MTFHSNKRHISPCPSQGWVIRVVCLVGIISALCVLPCHAGPIIASVSQISTQQLQTIVATGSGFGTNGPYAGNSLYIEFFDVTKGWAAGYTGPCYDGTNYYPGFCNDLVTLIVSSWGDSSIVLGGFSGAWGFSNWTLYMGDKVQITVWNAQSGIGPASIVTNVGSAPSGVPEPGGLVLVGTAIALLGALRFRGQR
jgi:hypothetical protein